MSTYCKDMRTMATTTIERQTAYLTTIGTLLNGNFVKAEAQMQPSFLRTVSGREMSRVHIIAVIVGFSDSNEATLDDGSGRITARSFDMPTIFSSFSLGDIVRVIGKVRAFNEQQYLIPEIVKKITNKQFVALHKLALQSVEANEVGECVPTKELSPEEVIAESVDEIPIDADDSTPHTPFDDVILQIKALDKGDGAVIEQIIEQLGSDSEKLIHHLLETGEIFEIRPGRVKLLD